MFLLFCSTLFVRKIWLSPRVETSRTYSIGGNVRVATPYESSFLFLLGYLLLVLMLFNRKCGLADWFLAVCLGAPEFPLLPIATISSCPNRSLSIQSHHFVFLGSVMITRLRPLWFVLLSVSISFLFLTPEYKAFVESWIETQPEQEILIKEKKTDDLLVTSES